MDRRFRFENLLEGKRKIEELQVIELLNVNNNIKKEETELLKQSLELQEVICKLYEGSNVKDISMRYNYSEVLKENIKIINERILALNDKKELILEKIVNMRKEIKTFEKLKEKHIEEYNEYIKKKEEKEINDIVSSKYNKRDNNNFILS